MSFRIVEWEMDGEAVMTRRIIADAAASLESAEALLVRFAQSHDESGYNPLGRYWWARDATGREIRFAVELTPADETDGV